MSYTSEYNIINKLTGEVAGTFHKNHLCKYPDYAELLKYQPLSDFMIVAYGYIDETDEDWEDDPEELEHFLREDFSYNKWLKAYFSGEKTAEEIIKELKDIQTEIFLQVKNKNKK